MKAFIFTILLLSSIQSTPQFSIIQEKLQDLQNEVEWAIGFSNKMSLQPKTPSTISPLKDSIDSILLNNSLFTSSCPLLVDNSEFLNISEAISKGYMKRLYVFDNKSTTDLLNHISLAANDISNSSSTFKQMGRKMRMSMANAREIISGSQKQVLTDDQSNMVIKTVINLMHVTLKDARDDFKQINSYILKPIQHVKAAKLLIKSLVNSLTSKKDKNGDYIQGLIESKYNSDMKDCHTICIFGYKNRLKGNVKICQTCLDTLYGDMIEGIIKKAQNEIKTVQQLGNDYHVFLEEWTSEASIYVKQFQESSSRWSIAELHFKDMIDTIENEKKFGEKFTGYCTELIKMLDNIDASLNASQNNVPVKLQA